MTVLWRGSLAQKIRLTSGLILFLFATAHFLNHALGLVSLNAMVVADGWRTAVTRSIPGAVILIAALLVHAALAVSKLFALRTLRLRVSDVWQIVLGFLIPVFLIPHVVSTSTAAAVFGVKTTYPYELARIWTKTIGNQTILMTLVWVHGCIGIHMWLRLQRGYVRIAPILLALAVLIPFAATVGVSVQGRAIAQVIADPERLAALKRETHWPDAVADERLYDWRDQGQTTFVLLLVGFAGVLLIRTVLLHRARHVVVSYAGGRTVRAEPGATLLDVSRSGKVPHMSVCGGRGRCSTCRVMVLKGQGNLSPASESELETLRAIKAGAGVRLACQARPLAEVTVAPLLRPSPKQETMPRITRQFAEDSMGGLEEDLAVLFVDMRGFTALTERRLPFDVVYILNQFFATVGQPVYEHGGWISNYAGDGLIALFSDGAGIQAACRAALLAAARIDEAVTALNVGLADEAQQTIRIAMGLHAGSHVIGRVGYRDSQSVSVIGLAINVASRLEALAKTAGAQIALSETVADHAGLATEGLRIEATDVRGLKAPIRVIYLDSARTLAERFREREPVG